MASVRFLQILPSLHIPLLRVVQAPITPTTTTLALHDALAAIGAAEINALLTDLVAGNITPTPQPDIGATYAEKLRKEESILDLSALTAAEIDRRMRALNPWPGTWTSIHHTRVKLLAASLLPADNSVSINCADGQIYVSQLQPEGGKPMPASVFFLGTRE